MRLAAKRLASLTCAAALMLSLAACSTSSASSAESTDVPSMSAPGEGTPPDGQPPEKPDGAPDGQGGPGGGFGGSGTVTQGTSANTHAVLSLSGVALSNEDSTGALMTICGNSASHGWGTAGKNGAQVEFTADSQTLSGAITVDTISTLDLTLKNGSTFTGTLNIVENAAGGTAVEDNAVVTLEKGSTWTLTGDCTLTSLTNNGTIHFNGHTITLADGTVLS